MSILAYSIWPSRYFAHDLLHEELLAVSSFMWCFLVSVSEEAFSCHPWPLTACHLWFHRSLTTAASAVFPDCTVLLYFPLHSSCSALLVSFGFVLNFFHFCYILFWNEESIEVVGKLSIFTVAQRCFLFCSLFLSQYFLAFICSCDSYWALSCSPHRPYSLVETCFILLSWCPKR